MSQVCKDWTGSLPLCLNISVDPPDVIKISPCARMECWIGRYFTPLLLFFLNFCFYLSFMWLSYFTKGAFGWGILEGGMGTGIWSLCFFSWFCFTFLGKSFSNASIMKLKLDFLLPYKMVGFRKFLPFQLLFFFVTDFLIDYFLLLQLLLLLLLHAAGFSCHHSSSFFFAFTFSRPSRASFLFSTKKRLMQSLNLFVFVLFILKNLNELSFRCDLMTKPGLYLFQMSFLIFLTKISKSPNPNPSPLFSHCLDKITAPDVNAFAG